MAPPIPASPVAVWWATDISGVDGDPISSWTEITSWPGAGASEVIVAGDTYFVGTAAPPANNIAESTDGATFTLHNAPFALTAMVWTGTKFVAAQGAASYTADPANLSSWTTAGATGTLHTIRRLVEANGVIIGTGLGTSGTVDLDMAAVHGTIQTIARCDTGPALRRIGRARRRLLDHVERGEGGSSLPGDGRRVTSGDFAALLLSVMLVAWVHAVGPATAVDQLIALLD